MSAITSQAPRSPAGPKSGPNHPGRELRTRWGMEASPLEGVWIPGLVVSRLKGKERKWKENKEGKGWKKMRKALKL